MSLRFDRKASSKLRASFSCRSRTEKERDEAAGKDQSQKEYLKSWSYRQCQFACDYLNLIESPTQAHLVRNLKTELVGKQNKEEAAQSSSSASSLKNCNGSGGGGGDAVESSILRTNSSNPNESNSTSGSKTSKLSGNMSSASLGSTLSIPASCVTTSSRSSFNSSILSTASSASSNHSSDSSSSCGGGSGSLYADLFELGYGSSSLLFRVSFFGFYFSMVKYVVLQDTHAYTHINFQIIYKVHVLCTYVFVTKKWIHRPSYF